MSPDFCAFRFSDLTCANRADISPTSAFVSLLFSWRTACTNRAHMNVKIGPMLVSVALFLPGSLRAEQVAVRQTEGLVHGFLALRNTAGTTLADGELLQVARGDQV